MLNAKWGVTVITVQFFGSLQSSLLLFYPTALKNSFWSSLEILEDSGKILACRGWKTDKKEEPKFLISPSKENSVLQRKEKLNNFIHRHP